MLARILVFKNNIIMITSSKWYRLRQILHKSDTGSYHYRNDIFITGGLIRYGAAVKGP